MTDIVQDYYSLYACAMDRQAQFEREAADRWLARHFHFHRPHASQRRRWLLAGRRDERKAALTRLNKVAGGRRPQSRGC